MTGNPALYIRDPQAWAIEQERSRHDEALYFHGEYVVIVLMYDHEDFRQGFTTRCSTCYGGAQAAAAEAYGQPTKINCPTCFGTTYEGGWKARLVRPSLWDMSEQDSEKTRRGEVQEQHAQVQFTWDFDAGLETFAFRGDGTRWKVVAQPQGSHVRTGFQRPSLDRTSVALASQRVVREDESSVAYLLPPTTAEVKAVLERTNFTAYRQPLDFSDFEVVRDPIRPNDP